MRNCLWVLPVALLLGGCGAIDARSVQDISAWGIGWQLKAPQNRIGPAIPPVVDFLRAKNSRIKAVEAPHAVAKSFQEVVTTLSDSEFGTVERRLIGLFTVSGQDCVLRGYPVRDSGDVVAAFLTLDSGAAAKRPSDWTLCHPQNLPTGRHAAFRSLLLSTLDRALGRS